MFIQRIQWNATELSIFKPTQGILRFQPSKDALTSLLKMGQKKRSSENLFPMRSSPHSVREWKFACKLTAARHTRGLDRPVTRKTKRLARSVRRFFFGPRRLSQIKRRRFVQQPSGARASTCVYRDKWRTLLRRWTSSGSSENANAHESQQKARSIWFVAEERVWWKSGTSRKEFTWPPMKISSAADWNWPSIDRRRWIATKLSINKNEFFLVRSN